MDLLLGSAAAFGRFHIIIIDTTLVSFDVTVKLTKFKIEAYSKCAVWILVKRQLVKIRGGRMGFETKKFTIRVVRYQGYGSFFIEKCFGKHIRRKNKRA